MTREGDWKPVFWGLVITFMIVGFIVSAMNSQEPQPNYKAFYEETQYNKTLQSAFNNGSIATIQAIQSGIQTNGLNSNLPWFNQEGNLTSVKLGLLCDTLEGEDG